MSPMVFVELAGFLCLLVGLALLGWPGLLLGLGAAVIAVMNRSNEG